MLTTLKRLREHGLDEVARVNDDGISPEVDLSFSIGDRFPHVHLALYSTVTGATAHHVHHAWLEPPERRPSWGRPPC